MFKPKPLSLAIVASLSASSALAQDNNATEDSIEEIVVTGTHIKGVDVAGALPVSQLSQEDLDLAGALSTEELIGELPQAGQIEFNSATEGTSSNSVRGDVASVNLRGLGADSTLILVNGRRMVLNPSSSTNSNGVPVQFVNSAMIPASGLDRVEVLRDGAAAIYGTDAIAGVVNYVLDTDYEGFEIKTRYGSGHSGSLGEASLQLRGGFAFNDDASNITFFASDFNRSGVTAQEIDYTKSSDYRDTDRTPSLFIGDTSLRNLSTFTPWGQFNLGQINPDGSFTPVGVSGMARGSDGRFHLQPASSAGGVAYKDGLEIDDGTLNSDLRYNINDQRMILPELERRQFFTTFTHEFDNGVELFSEASYYESEYQTYFGPNVISDVNKMYIPKTAYYNPFGAVGNPNRIAGLDLADVPADGLDVKIDRLRLYDTGPRFIDTEADSYRFLVGARGNWNDWDWESAAYKSAANADDSQVSVSRSKFYQAVSRSTADAYNPFTGGNFADPANGDPSSGGDASEFTVNVKRQNRTSISGMDFKASTPELFSWAGGDIGAAFGVEQRRETYKDDRDPLLDGSVTFTNPLSGQFFSSDVMGVSATPDTVGSREVFSAYAEFMVPLVNEDMGIPLVKSLDAQIALRAEKYSDVDDDILKPKFALSWRPADWLQVRSAYSKGFRAPNLETLNLTVQERFNNNEEDFLRCAAGQALGTPEEDVDACSASINSRRLGNKDLESEESDNITFGVVIEPLEGLVITADWWQIEQEGVVGLFGQDNHLILDQIMRFNGSSNPNVVRAAPTAQDQLEINAYNAANGTSLAAVGDLLYINDTFLNLQPRTVEGADFSVSYDTAEYDIGSFTLKFDGAYIAKWDQEASPQVKEILAAAAANPLITGAVSSFSSGSQIEDEATPRWRAKASVTWRLDNWRAGISARYVGKVYDPDVKQDDDPNIVLKIPSWTTVNTYVNYKFDQGALADTSIRLGANNLFDEEPPLFDASRGYSSSLHSARGRYVYLDLSKKF
ncbi:MAG: TonB-dependent receptor [Cellvibrionaceae bacterium]|nr:TonB-dependent receptor [Cellvibrionaceae bacterium]